MSKTGTALRELQEKLIEVGCGSVIVMDKEWLGDVRRVIGKIADYADLEVRTAQARGATLAMQMRSAEQEV